MLDSHNGWTYKTGSAQADQKHALEKLFTEGRPRPGTASGGSPRTGRNVLIALVGLLAVVASGDIPLAVNTVENFIDACVDHVAIIDFESFKGLTDGVGGVAVNNPIPFTSTHGAFHYAEGEITLNGAVALGFVRERYAFTDGDYQRTRNQQIYLKGLFGTLLSKETLTNPATITGTFNAVKPYLVVDEGLTLNAAIGLGFEMKNFSKENISFFTSPTLGAGISGDGQSIVLPDWNELQHLRTAMRDGTLNYYAETRAAGSELTAR